MTGASDTAAREGVTVPMGDTWRYQGERAAADTAYCQRFNVAAAPEPVAMKGGIWAYTLPASRRTP